MRSQDFRAQDYPEYQQYNTQYPGVKETIGFSLWDTQTYTSTSTVALTFFTATQPNRIDLSNMELAGQLAAPKAFLIRSIVFMIKQRPESTVGAADGALQTGCPNNVFQLCNTGILQLTIGAKNYAQFPLFLLPSGGGAYGKMDIQGETGTVGGVCSWATVGIPKISNTFSLGRPIFIAPQINFNVQITWPAGVTLTRSLPVSVLLDGDLIRPVQ